MVVYEVNLAVDNNVAESFAVWLREHVAEILTLSGFVDATWYYREPSEVRQLWTVHYRLSNLNALQQYLENHAERMRAEGIEKFGGRFEADRRVLIEREVFRRDAS